MAFLLPDFIFMIGGMIIKVHIHLKIFTPSEPLTGRK